ncbi:MAG: hypothetical protein LKF74_03450 [Megasphaera sp.]|jgi:hypothetical protein|nr:hypothetical protein [Megasphaera sp.]MCH4187700.1 hypothetical protein [Megasphaera sp.]MCH4217599.1 hypothetical protein [Megasphaera sp.]
MEEKEAQEMMLKVWEDKPVPESKLREAIDIMYGESVPAMSLVRYYRKQGETELQIAQMMKLY